MKIGSLFTGYGGLDIAVNGELAWYSEIDKSACTILERHYPNIQNKGDVKKIDWTKIEKVDVLTGGYPCQPFSIAGNRKGEDDERHLWPYVMDAIRTIRPRFAIMENVAGHLTMGFDTVLTDLAKAGMSVQWTTLRASDVGAPHRRERLFFVAYTDSVGSQEADNFVKLLRPSGQLAPGFFTTTYPKYYEWQRVRHFSKLGVRYDLRPDFGHYAEAIAQWEYITGRRAPKPLLTNKNKKKLNPELVEWMMGLPQGWVTDNDIAGVNKFKLLGNGVVPLQANEAIAQLLGRIK
jgi:DNA (cytosine-5)-methyltransferase 1